MSTAKVTAERLLQQARKALNQSNAAPAKLWAYLHRQVLTPDMDFAIHQECYQQVYQSSSDSILAIQPSWYPSVEEIQASNIQKMMNKNGFVSYQDFYHWSITEREQFWKASVHEVDIQWEKKPNQVFQGDPAHVQYFPEASLNIADSCFHKRDKDEPALVYAMESAPRDIQTMSFETLSRLSNQIANALHQKFNLNAGDSVAICMPMTPESVAIYLGIVKAGCVVVSIADSFSAQEIATRCRLGKAKAIFTQDVIYRGAKFLPLYDRVLEADSILQQKRFQDQSELDRKESMAGDDLSMRVVVLPGMLHAGPYPKLANMTRSESGTWNDRDVEGNPVALHPSVLSILRSEWDCDWHDFLHHCSDQFVSVKRSAMDACNILFSSGTTGEPKAIVWSHSTPIKCAIDGFYHQDIQKGERVTWPSNIGWMMGPWLVYQLINGATLGIFNGITSTDAFCQFIEEAEISMVGVIPSLVKAWQAKNATEKCDWSRVRRFSSTGEASDPANYLWLASRVPGYAPIMEYCGGTEIGGSFLSSTIVQPNVPSMFSSPVLASQIVVLDGEGNVAPESTFEKGNEGAISGEIALVPPSIGLSTHLLNRDHYETYFKDMPAGPSGEVLRRHGDEIEVVRGSRHYGSSDTALPYYRALGRCDDTMNIGGIKVGSIEIERVCNLVPSIQETAAIAVSARNGGPSKLVIYVVLEKGASPPSEEDLKASMQKSIKSNLNPLFGISDIVVTDTLPRTASNKVMRRLLRDEYVKANSEEK